MFNDNFVLGMNINHTNYKPHAYIMSWMNHASSVLGALRLGASPGMQASRVWGSSEVDALRVEASSRRGGRIS